MKKRAKPRFGKGSFMRSLAILLLSLAAAAWPAAAQEPPSRVGRLAFHEGPVSLYQDPDLGWERAYVNSPVTSENSLWTERGARAEMRVSGSAVRLAELTQLDVSVLDDLNLDAFVPRGSVAVHVRYKERDERVAFSTPQARFVL